MSKLEEIKARGEELGRTNTRDLANKIIDCGAEYTLLAKVEADHGRLIAALEAVCRLADDAVTTLRHGGGGLALADDVNAAIAEALA